MKKYLNLSQLKYIGALYAFYSLITLCKNAYLKYIGENYEAINWHTLIVKVHLYDWILVLFYMAFVIIIIKYLNEKKVRWYYHIPVHLFLSLALGYYLYVVSTIIEVAQGIASFSDFSYAFNQVRIIFVIDLNFLIYTSLITIIYVHDYLKRLQEIRKQNNALADELGQAKLRALRLQLHPKFLYSELHNIRSIIDIDEKKSEQLIVDMSELLRGMIDEDHEHPIPLNHEIAFTEKYLKIKNAIRQVYQVSFTIEQSCENIEIPPLFFLQLFESLLAIRKDGSKFICEINISQTNSGDSVKVEVRILDKIISWHSLESRNILWNNLLSKLNRIYGGDFQYELISGDKTQSLLILVPFSQAEFSLLKA